MPVYARGFRQMVFEDDADAIPLVCLNRWSRGASVEAPEIENPSRNDRLLYRLGNQAKDLDAVVHRKRQVGDVWRHDGQGRARIRLPGCDILLRSCSAGQRYSAGSDSKNALEKPSSGMHSAFSSPFIASIRVRQRRLWLIKAGSAADGWKTHNSPNGQWEKKEARRGERKSSNDRGERAASQYRPAGETATL